jgi:hypothetical protein
VLQQQQQMQQPGGAPGFGRGAPAPAQGTNDLPRRGTPVDDASPEAAMSGDTTVKKVSGTTSPRGAMGQVYLTSGKRVAMRLWRDEPPRTDKPSVRRDYETVGYVIAGRAELTVEGQTLRLEPGTGRSRRCPRPADPRADDAYAAV